jgi:hypothetical protein
MHCQHAYLGISGTQHNYTDVNSCDAQMVPCITQERHISRHYRSLPSPFFIQMQSPPCSPGRGLPQHSLLNSCPYLSAMSVVASPTIRPIMLPILHSSAKPKSRPFPVNAGILRAGSRSVTCTYGYWESSTAR